MKTTLELTTNNHDRKFVIGHEVPMGVLRSQFDHLTAYKQSFGSFLKYRGHWYHVSDFTRFGPLFMAGIERATGGAEESPFEGWHGRTSDSAWSGVVIKLSDDGETYQIGTYILRG